MPSPPGTPPSPPGAPPSPFAPPPVPGTIVADEDETAPPPPLADEPYSFPAFPCDTNDPTAPVTVATRASATGAMRAAAARRRPWAVPGAPLAQRSAVLAGGHGARILGSARRLWRRRARASGAIESGYVAGELSPGAGPVEGGSIVRVPLEGLAWLREDGFTWHDGANNSKRVHLGHAGVVQVWRRRRARDGGVRIRRQRRRRRRAPRVYLAERDGRRRGG